MKSFQELNTPQQDTLVLVDSLNLAFRYKHSGAKKFVDQYIQTIESLKKSYKASKMIITCDDGSSQYRKNILPEYKANRKEKYETQTEQERLDFLAFLEEFNCVLTTIKEFDDYPVLKFSGVEADDIGAYIVNKCKKQYQIWLMSSDKDWDLLIDKNVSRFSYVTRKEVTLDNWNEHYEYDPDDHISIKCLTGDSGDNIAGVSGIGPKKALALVREYGTCYDIIANLPISSRYKYIQSLNEFGADALMLNYQLMDLMEFCDEALGPTNCQTINNTLKNHVHAN